MNKQMFRSFDVSYIKLCEIVGFYIENLQDGVVTLVGHSLIYEFVYLDSEFRFC